MQQVSKEVFFNLIKNRDIVLKVFGKYPYTTEYKTRSGTLVGKSVDSYVNGKKGITKNEKFINLEFIERIPELR